MKKIVIILLMMLPGIGFSQTIDFSWVASETAGVKCNLYSDQYPTAIATDIVGLTYSAELTKVALHKFYGRSTLNGIESLDSNIVEYTIRPLPMGNFNAIQRLAKLIDNLLTKISSL